MRKLFTLIAFAIFTNFSFGQNSSFWTAVPEFDFAKAGTRQIVPNHYRTVRLNVAAFQQAMATVPMERNAQNLKQSIVLPMPDGSFQRFEIVESPIMEAGLAAQFPEIKTYLVQGVDNRTATGRLDWTYRGFHGLILSDQGSVFIDPYDTQTLTDYIVYYKKDFYKNQSLSCLTEGKISIDEDAPHTYQPTAQRSGDVLRTYRLAMSCTGEYAQFHGGTVNGAFSGMTTTMNRVNGVYEREVAVRMVFVANNTSLIYLNGSTDPFNNNNSNQIVNQNQTVIDNAIGSANYDIGHVVSTGGGGFAPGPVCQSGNKAKAVTGSPAPVGDPFDIDYVAHEMGHQFDGSHIFNGSTGSCQFARVGSAAYEPGSGTTIMGYAGICSSQNIQVNSDDYFNTHNFDEIYTYITTGAGATCDVPTNTGNHQPIVDAGTGGYSIPKSTPFELIGSATDIDGDALTYCWEQHDLGPQGAPNNPSGNAPIFRSFDPVSVPSRVFPRIQNVINNNQTLGEILPSYARTMNFRLTARDNKAGGGGVNYDGITISVASNAGPFVVTEPNTAGIIWQELVPSTVSWDVSNTNIAPVNCTSVNILLSLDGGYTYPITLATGVPNNGTATVIPPIGSQTFTARVRVQGANNVFFDISNVNFKINMSVPDYSVVPIETQATACTGDSAVFKFYLSQIANYNQPITLTATGVPANVTATFSTNPAMPGDTVTLTLTNTEDGTAGDYSIDVQMTSTSANRNLTLDFALISDVPPVTTLLSPDDTELDVSEMPVLIWTSGGNTPQQSYDVEIADNVLFTNLVASATGISDTFFIPTLDPYKVYYWRVRAYNICATGEFSEFKTFRTGTKACKVVEGATVVSISGGNAFTYTSNLAVTDTFELIDLDVLNVQGTHSRISDLSMALQSPQGTLVQLLPRQTTCTAANFNFNLDDASTTVTFPCPPTNGNTIRPAQPLATFNGERAQGVWAMKITDHVSANGGQFQSFKLNLCYAQPSTNSDPILVKNDTFKVEIGTTQPITNLFLLSEDADNTPAELTYTLLSVPEKGNLQLNTTTLAVGETFTQADLDAERLTYQHLGTIIETDRFRFNVADPNGGWFGNPYFNILSKEADIIIDPDKPFGIYPNPVSSVLNIDFIIETDQTVVLTVFDALGRVVHDASFTLQKGGHHYEIPVQSWAAGLYFVRFESAEQQATQKILVAF